MKIVKIILFTLISLNISANDFADLSTRDDGYVAIGIGSQQLTLDFNAKFGYLETRVLNPNPGNPTSKGNKNLSVRNTGFLLHAGQFIKPDVRIGAQLLTASNSDLKTTMFGAYSDYLFNNGLYTGVGFNYVFLDFSKEDDIKAASGIVASYRAGFLYKIGDNLALDFGYQFANKFLTAKHEGYQDSDLSDGDHSVSSGTEVGHFKKLGFC